MYLSHFGLTEAPFSIAPDPRFLFLSPRHREALAHLLYGLRTDGGFVLLTGEVGTGKTTTCRGVLVQTPDSTDLAFLLNPRVTALELLQSICDELRISYPADTSSTKVLVDLIQHQLLASHAAGRSTLLVIDEAQNLAPDVLEQLRLLTNLETDTHKLLRIILLGQPELAQMLDSPALRQLAQRVTARYHLAALSRKEVHAYIGHRVAVAGGSRNPFSRSAMDHVARVSGGIPRRINVICDRAMLGAFTRQRTSINRAIMVRAAAEVQGHADAHLGRSGSRLMPLAATVLLATTLGLAGGWWLFGQPSPSSAEVVGPVNMGTDNQIVDPSPAQPAPKIPAPAPAITDANNTPVLGATTAPSPVPLAVTDSTPIADSPRIIGPDSAVLALAKTRQSASPDLAFWSTRAATATGRNAALSEIYKLWLLPKPPPDADGCDYAATVGMRCAWEDSNWADLRSIHLPVILYLQLDDSSWRWFALAHADDNQAELQVDGQRVTVPLGDLLDRWQGDFIVLWQTPPGYRGGIGQGADGADVSWLRGQLRRHTGMGLTSRNTELFDAELTQALKIFQSSQGLEADGVAGTRTWIRLYTLANTGADHVIHP